MYTDFDNEEIESCNFVHDYDEHNEGAENAFGYVKLIMPL